MKIGNSTIQFNLSVVRDNRRGYPTGRKYNSIAEVPYWKLYARPGDCISPNWKSQFVLTYEDIVGYLTNYKGHRVLEAYPRKTEKQNNTYAVCRHDIDEENANLIHIVLKDSNYIVCTYDTNTNSIVWISPNYKNKKQYFINQYLKYPDWMHAKLSKLLNTIK